MTKKCKNFRAFPRFRDFSPKDANVIPFLKGHSNLNQTHETSPPSKEIWNFVDLKTILVQKQIKPIAVDRHFFYIFWKPGIIWRKVDAAEQAWEKVHILQGTWLKTFKGSLMCLQERDVLFGETKWTAILNHTHVICIYRYDMKSLESNQDQNLLCKLE